MIYPNVSGSKGSRSVLTYPDFVGENLRWRPRDESIILVNTVDKERSSPSDVVDGLLDDGLDPGRLDHNVESEWVILL